MMFKKKNHTLTFDEADEQHARRQRIVVMLIIMLIFAGFYSLTFLGPKKIGANKTGADAGKEVSAADDIAKELEPLRGALNEIKNPQSMTPAQIEILKKTIDLLDKLMAAKRGSSIVSEMREAEKYRKIWDDYHGMQLKDESDACELMGKELAQKREWGKAAGKIRQAMELQKRINDDYPSSSACDIKRFNRLKAMQQDIIATPDYEAIRDIEDKYRKALAENRIEDAKSSLQQLVERIGAFLDQYHESKLLDFNKLGQLKSELVTLNSRKMAKEIDDLAERAGQMAKEQKYDEASGLYGEAAARQDLLNKNFAKSSYYSIEKIKSFEAKKQDAASHNVVEGVRKASAELDAAIRDGNRPEIKRLIASIQDGLSSYKSFYKQGAQFGNEFQERIDFLKARQENIPELREAIMKWLKPVPGEPKRLMSAIETTQDMYEKIMGQNPSRSSGPLLPVDSVTWNEAAEFCVRAGWLLGRKACLPSKELFQKAAGTPAAAEAASQSWNSANTKMLAQPAGTSAPNAAGFYDLLGNVAEWLDADASKEKRTALVAGGTAQDSPGTLASVPMLERPKTERNRFIGFRIACEAGE